MLLTGKDSKYRSLHYWVEKNLGKPMECEECGDSSRSRYHWANISQEYQKELNDWKRLCVPCHRKFDLKHRPYSRVSGTHCRKGHELTPENIYFKVGRGVRECRTCKSEHMKNFYARKRATA